MEKVIEDFKRTYITAGMTEKEKMEKVAWYLGVLYLVITGFNQPKPRPYMITELKAEDRAAILLGYDEFPVSI